MKYHTYRGDLRLGVCTEFWSPIFSEFWSPAELWSPSQKNFGHQTRPQLGVSFMHLNTPNLK